LSYELKIALRFLIRGKSQTIFILFGIALGVAVQIFLGNLITSLQSSLIEQTIGNSAHITVSRQDDDISLMLSGDPLNTVRGNYPSLVKNLENWQPIATQIEADQDITVVSPALQGTAIIRSSGKTVPVQVKGIQLDKGDQIYNITQRLISGNPALEGNNIFIGTSMAKDLGLIVGSGLNLLLPNGSTAQMIVGGIFDLQNEGSNSSLVIMDLARAQKLYGAGSGITALEIQVGDPFAADTISSGLVNAIPGVSIKNWKEQNGQLLIALTSQSSSSYTIQLFVIIAVTFGIASVLAVSVVQKSKQIGILKAMGATKKSAARIFIYEGFILGLLGAIAGSGLGVLLLAGFGSANTTFALTVEPRSVLLIVFISVAAGTISALIPARNSSELNPMEAIRNG
jgi:lipoprotein-releasing system permease protein